MIDAEITTVGTAVALIAGAGAAIAAPIGIVASFIWNLTPWGADNTKKQLKEDPETQALIDAMIEKKIREKTGINGGL